VGILGDIFNAALGGAGQAQPQQRQQQQGSLQQQGRPAFPQRQVFYCKYCGMEYPDVRNLTHNQCPNHPLGKHGHNHELYEGGVKQQYTCKHCGMTNSSLRNLVRNYCHRNPSGNKCHEPAL